MKSEPNTNKRPNTPPRHGKPEKKIGSQHFRKRRSARAAAQKMSDRAAQENNARTGKSSPESPRQELKICRVCGKPIFDLAGAMASREDSEPIHFDCAIEILSKEDNLAPDEKLIYVGSGFFAVCVQSPSGKLEIRRKIRWEIAGTQQPWRKPMIFSPNLP